MSKLFSFFRLIGFLWNNSDKLISAFGRLQQQIPPTVVALRQSATGLVAAASAITDAGAQSKTAIRTAGEKIDSVSVPKPTISTTGFMDVLYDGIKEIFTPDPPSPPQNTKDIYNRFRVPTKADLDVVKPFADVSTYLKTSGDHVLGMADQSRDGMENTAQGLRLLADFLETINVN